MGKLPSWSLNLVQPPYQDGTGVVCAHSVSITKCVHTTAVPSGILFGPRRAPFFCSFFINLLSHRPFLTHNNFKQKKYSFQNHNYQKLALRARDTKSIILQEREKETEIIKKPTPRRLPHAAIFPPCPAQYPTTSSQSTTCTVSVVAISRTAFSLPNQSEICRSSTKQGTYTSL